ncbi:Palmitoleoyl-protein carboxylesterase NOTUM, partial [Gryllus bimaculatus]
GQGPLRLVVAAALLCAWARAPHLAAAAVELALELPAEDEPPPEHNAVAAPSLSSIRRLVQMLEARPPPAATAAEGGLRRVFLNAPNATCNDGTPAGYYVRESPGSRRWILFLEGGWYCYDRGSCANRWARLRHLMSSSQWPKARSVGGLLSASPRENPHWWDANHVLLPYCTSDTWAGWRLEPAPGVPFRFLGGAVLRAVVAALLPSLRAADSLLLAGSSAGAAGVLLNVDAVAAQLRGAGLRRVQVRGVADSGWFLDRALFAPSPLRPAPAEAARRGHALWRGRVPEPCRRAHAHEPWRCYFGYRLYPTLAAPVFVFQWLFDEAQLAAENVGAPLTHQQWEHVHRTGDALRQSLLNVTAVFAPACVAHTVLTRADWTAVRVGGLSLPQALRCWESQLPAPPPPAPAPPPTPSSLRGAAWRRGGASHGRRPSPPPRPRPPAPAAAASTARLARPRAGHRRKHRARGRHRKRKGARAEAKAAVAATAARRRRRRRRRSPGAGAGACALRAVERCSWPQCTLWCPRLLNPLTGQELELPELLQAFGLDMRSAAAALGVDLAALRSMGRARLLQLLTQQGN